MHYWCEHIIGWWILQNEVGAKKLLDSHLLPTIHEIDSESEDSLRKLQPAYLNHHAMTKTNEIDSESEDSSIITMRWSAHPPVWTWKK